MPSRLTHRRVVHKPTAGRLHSIPEAVGLVGNPPPDLTQNTVAGLVSSAPLALGISGMKNLASVV
jgi:hypothetical protein